MTIYFVEVDNVEKIQSTNYSNCKFLYAYDN